MATVNAYPVSDDDCNWIPNPSMNHYENVDEDSGTLNASDYNSAGEITGNDGDYETYGMTDANIVGGTTSNITVYTYGLIIGSNSPEIQIGTGGSWQSVQETGLTTTAAWKTNSFSVSWSQAQVNAMQVRYIADCPVKNDYNRVCACYAVITYTPASGYAHEFIGVAGANISEVNGVASANISTIKGV